MVDCGGLENRWPARARGFESHPLRHAEPPRAEGFVDKRPRRPEQSADPSRAGRWQSGRLRRLAKPLTGVFSVRGFESLPARHVGRAAALLVAALLPGCVTRTMFVDSDPPGATVWLDGERSGTTPYEAPIPAYGTRHLELDLEGYERLSTDLDLYTPWYQYWPIDFIANLLWPWGVVDDRRFAFTLQPAVPAADDWAAAEEAARRANAVGAAVEGE